MSAKSAISSELDAVLTVLREHGRVVAATRISFITSENDRISETRLEIELEDEIETSHGRMN